MVRVTGNLSLDGNSITLTQGGNSTTLQGGSPSGDITITLPSTSAPILVNPMDSAGDMMYGGASGTITKLDAGTANYLLQANGAAAPTWNLITNANVDAAAAIALSKLATVTASRALVSDGSGNISAATTTSTQIGYLSAATGTTGTTSTNIVFSTSPTLITPVLGAASATSINKVAITEPASGSTLTIADGKTLTASNTLTFTGTDSSSVAFGAGGTVAYQGGTLAQFAATTSLQLKDTISDETGSGALVFGTNASLTTPSISNPTITDGGIFGTPSSLTLTNATGLPISTGVSGLGTGVASFLADPSSLKLRTAMLDSSGTGAIVFRDTPTLITPVLGVATATSVNKVAFTAPATAATLTLADGSTLATSGANSITLTSTGATNVTLPTTGTLVTLAGTEALTNKDFQGGTASNSSRITVPSAAKATLDALTRKEATIVYATDTDRLYVDDGSTLNEVGSSTGAGEKNYITNPSAAATIGNWTAVGDLDVARTTTAADLPREYTTATGIKITADSNTQSTADYVYYDFTLDDVDLSKKLKIQWSQKTTGTYNAGDLAVVITTQADRTTALITPQVTAIPAADTVFTTTFDSTTTATLSLVIRATTDMTTNGGITISDVVVGPGLPVQGAAIGEWTSYTPDIANFPDSAQATKWRRVGDTMEVWGTSTATGAVSGTITIPLPSGHTIDTTKNLGTTANSQAIYGLAEAVDGGAVYYQGMITYESTSAVKILSLAAADYWRATVPMTWANTDTLSFSFKVPIAEWSGNGTVNLGQNDVEYASNSSSTDAADTTSFVYGQGGSVGIFGTTALTAQRAKRVRFQKAIQQGDKIDLEIYDPTGGEWLPHNNNRNGSFAWTTQNSVSYGIALQGVNSTDVDVVFERYAVPNGATFGAAGSAWSGISSSTKWRLKKSSGGQAVGFSKATNGELGLVNTYTDYTTASTFTFNGSGGTTASTTLRAQRLGDFVTLHIPAVTGTSGTSSTTLTANTALPSWARPLTATQYASVPDMKNNNLDLATPGLVGINTSGILAFNRDAAATAWTNTSTCGNGGAFIFTYYVGTGS